MKTTRKRYSAEFKAKVAMEAIRGDLALAELAAKHGVHHTMIGAWKRQAMEGMSSLTAAIRTPKPRKRRRSKKCTPRSGNCWWNVSVFWRPRLRSENRTGILSVAMLFGNY